MRLPLYLRMLDDPYDNLGFPVDFPFKLYFDAVSGIVRQQCSGELETLLQQAYCSGSIIIGQMAAQGIGKRYAQDFLDYILAQIKNGGVRGRKVLEIGCGTGYLLARLQERGAIVLGIEPGYSSFEKQESQVPIISEFFPSHEIKEEFDLILLYGVLEHVPAPEKFLAHCINHLRTAGKIVISVPNCETGLRDGDLSILVHEHMSYFTRNALHNLLCRAGLSPTSIRPSGFGGAIYGVGERKAIPDLRKISTQDIRTFLNGGKKQCLRLKAIFDSFQNVAIYVPARLMNQLYLLKGEIASERLLLIDDSPDFHNKFLPGIPTPCLPFDAILERRIDCVLIATHTFERPIVEKVQAAMDTRILRLKDLNNDLPNAKSLRHGERDLAG